MKIYKSLAVLLTVLALGSCFDPPELPNVPQIEFVDINFIEGNATNRTDSLIVTLRFQDGDGDLGIDPTLQKYNEAPYNNVTLYQTNKNDPRKLIPINTIIQSVDHINKNNVKETEILQLLPIQDASLGKLVFPQTRNQPGYEYLPAMSCEFYENFRTANFAIEAKHKDVLDASTVVDTLFSRINGAKVATHFIISDFLYFTVNPNHYNIDIDFLVKDPSNPQAVDGFVLYDWRKEFCQQDLDGRFPILNDNGPGPLEGTIRYAMTSIGLRRIFTIKTLKLKIKIRDQAFNESNTIYTKEFTL
jgi:hypothetical protein